MCDKESNPLIVTIGVHILDTCVQYVDHIPPGQGICLVDDINFSVAGTAAGTAVDLAKLGCNVTSIGAVGNDKIGDILLDMMSKSNINTEFIVRKSNTKTSATILPIRSNGERPALHMLGANAEFCYDDISENVLKEADYIHFGGFYLMKSFDGEDTVKALKLAKESNAITSMDVLGIQCDDMASKILPCMKYLDYFMPNYDEAKMITCLENIDEMADFFLTAGVHFVILKMGHRGCFLKSKDGLRVRIPAYDVKVVDTTGCGDGWSAGFIAGLSRGMSLLDAAYFASACGSLVATGLSSNAGIDDFETALLFMKNTKQLPLLDT